MKKTTGSDISAKSKRVSRVKPERNTELAPTDPRRDTPKFQLYKWQFTLKSEIKPNELENDPNRFVAEARHLAETLNDIAKEWYMQLEMGDKSQYLHYQGCLSLKTKEYFQAVKNLLGRNDVHLEGAKNWNALKAYCSKNETRFDGPWSHKTVWLKTITNLFPWQQELVDIISRPCEDDRTIHWFYDKEGNKGKTQLCKYLFVNFGATVVNNGGFSDLAYVLPQDPKIVCFCLPRTLESRVNYSAIEAIKDGLIFSGKYESKTKVFNSPHVVVMANFAPNLGALSLDRWKLYNITDNNLNELEIEQEPWVEEEWELGAPLPF